MTDQRELAKTQRAKLEERVRCLKSYVNSLTEMAEKHGTEPEHFEEDLTKARSDLEYYEAQMGHFAGALEAHPAARRRFQVYGDAGGDWRRRLVAGNDRVIADSGEGYRDRRDCPHGIELVKESADAEVEEVS